MADTGAEDRERRRTHVRRSLNLPGQNTPLAHVNVPFHVVFYQSIAVKNEKDQI